MTGQYHLCFERKDVLLDWDSECVTRILALASVSSISMRALWKHLLSLFLYLDIKYNKEMLGVSPISFNLVQTKLLWSNHFEFSNQSFEVGQKHFTGQIAYLES